MLSFRLLGQVALFKDGESLDHFRSRKEVALLIYLAHTGQRQSRDLVGELLWQGRSIRQMRSNLRTALTRLRRQVGEDLVASRTALTLSAESRQAVDSSQLLDALSRFGSVDSAPAAAALQTILDVYVGDFLADFRLEDAPLFDMWVTTTQEHIRRQVVAGYKKLGDYAINRGEPAQGIVVAQRWLHIDPFDEHAHSLQIQLMLVLGQRDQAMAHYERYAASLAAELDAEPSADLRALIQTLPTPHTTVVNKPKRANHNLPAPYDQFFGRKQTQQEIHSRLDQPWCRVVSIVGQGGVGKTRLATTIARRRVDRYRDGIWLVELESVDPDDIDVAEAMAVEIASVLDLRLGGSSKPLEQLLDFLQHKQMLLVLDNFEHLVAGVQLVMEIVRRCESVQMLVTSRRSLQIRAEWVIALSGLSHPVRDSDPSDAVDMFVARYAQQQRDLLSPGEVDAVRSLCRLARGLPLAIELAAALTRNTTIWEISQAMQNGFDKLTATMLDIPARHQSLRMVFDVSWNRLTDELQRILARLSVFLGGFTAKAAQDVVGAKPEHLFALCHRSLLIRNNETDRYLLHPVIRAFAQEELATDDMTSRRHAHYFLGLLVNHTQPLQQDTPQRSVAAVEAEIDNVRLAWQTAISHRQIDLLSAGLTAFSIYYQLQGLAREAEATMQSTVDGAVGWGDPGICLAVRAGLELARFQNRLSRYRLTIKTLHTALQWASQVDDAWAEAMGNVFWGESLWRIGEYAEAQNRLRHAMAVGQKNNHSDIMGWCHHHLGIIDDMQGRYTNAQEHLQNASGIWRRLNNAQLLSVSLNSVGLVCQHQGDTPTARRAMEESLALCNQIDYRHLQAMLLGNLSILSIEMGDYADAHRFLQEGLDLAIANGNLTTQGDIYVNMGRNYRLTGDLEQAVQHLERGLQLAEFISNRTTQAIALLNLADVRREQGKVADTKSLLWQALAIAREDDLKSVQCEVLIRMAELLGKDARKEAKQYSTEAVSLAETLRNPRLVGKAKAIDGYLQVSIDINQ